MDSVPTNTPAEGAWVTTEMKSSDTPRLVRLMSSKESARHQLKEIFSEFLEKAALLQQAQNARNAEAAQSVWLAPLMPIPLEHWSINGKPFTSIYRTYDWVRNDGCNNMALG